MIMIAAARQEGVGHGSDDLTYAAARLGIKIGGARRLLRMGIVDYGW